MSDDVFIDMLEDDFDEPKEIIPPCFREAAEIARELLALGGWTGAQIQELERYATMEEDDADCLGWVEEMRDARAREEALKPRLP